MFASSSLGIIFIMHDGLLENNHRIMKVSLEKFCVLFNPNDNSFRILFCFRIEKKVFKHKNSDRTLSVIRKKTLKITCVIRNRHFRM